MIFSYLSFLWKRPPRSGQPQGAFSVGKQVSNPVRGREPYFASPVRFERTTFRLELGMG